MAQLLLHGTNFVNFVGLHAWIGLEGGFEAMRVTEWDEPQAVIGSYLHRYAYPDFYRMHVERNDRELIELDARPRPSTADCQRRDPRARGVRQHRPGHARPRSRCLQHRGEYMYVAEGDGGFRSTTSPAIGNKGFSERIVTAPFSPLGHDTRVGSRNATCMALPTNQPIRPDRNDAMAATPAAAAGRHARSACSRRIRSSASTRSTIMRW